MYQKKCFTTEGVGLGGTLIIESGAGSGRGSVKDGERLKAGESNLSPVTGRGAIVEIENRIAFANNHDLLRDSGVVSNAAAVEGEAGVVGSDGISARPGFKYHLLQLDIEGETKKDAGGVRRGKCGNVGRSVRHRGRGPICRISPTVVRRIQIPTGAAGMCVGICKRECQTNKGDDCGAPKGTKCFHEGCFNEARSHESI